MYSSTVATTYGPTLVGSVVAAAFYGITCAQTCRYYLLSHKDGKMLKTAVYVLWCLDTLHIMALLTSVYFYFIINRGKPAGSASIWTDGALIIISNISNFVVRCIILNRICSLCDRECMSENVRPVVIIVLSSVILIAAIFGIFFGAIFTMMPPGQAHYNMDWPLYAGLSSEAAADLAITTALCVCFSHLRQAVDTSFPLMNKLILYAICSGMLPCLIALGSLTTFILYPETFLYIGVFFPLSKAILNSILATLNVRKKLSHILPSAKVRMLEKALDGPPDESLHRQSPSIGMLMKARPAADSWAFVSSFVSSNV